MKTIAALVTIFVIGMPVFAAKVCTATKGDKTVKSNTNDDHTYTIQLSSEQFFFLTTRFGKTDIWLTHVQGESLENSNGNHRTIPSEGVFVTSMADYQINCDFLHDVVADCGTQDRANDEILKSYSGCRLFDSVPIAPSTFRIMLACGEEPSYTSVIVKMKENGGQCKIKQSDDHGSSTGA